MPSPKKSIQFLCIFLIFRKSDRTWQKTAFFLSKKSITGADSIAISGGISSAQLHVLHAVTGHPFERRAHAGILLGI